jgi:hypothetical protein
MAALSEITPSTRDLAHFISPNPGKSSRLVAVTPDFFRTPGAEGKMNQWEDGDIAALVTRTPSHLPASPRQDLRTGLARAAALLSCPFIAFLPVANPSDITALREVGFDGAIADAASFSDIALAESASLAQTLHFRLIFTADRREDFLRVKNFSPRFAYVTQDNEFTRALASPTLWLIGPAELESKLPLKGILYDG